MSDFPSRGLFIAGTDTDAGKTYVAGLIVQALRKAGHRIGAYKPVSSGMALGPDDCEQLAGAADVAELERVCPQRFRLPLAPHLAAKADGVNVDESLLVQGLCYWKGHCDLVVVEGVGGLMSPVAEDLYCADLAYQFGYPLIVVVPNRLGAINQALQTLITASTYCDGLSIAGIVISDLSESLDPSATTNPIELAERCTPPLLAHVRFGQQEIPNVDWWALSEPK